MSLAIFSARALNLASSKSRAPKALTTLIPDRFSCRTVVIAPVSCCTLIQTGRSARDRVSALHRISGRKAMHTRASRQFVTAMRVDTAPIVTKIDSPRTIPILTNVRTASTSCVALDMRSPVCSLSKKPKLMLCSFLKKSSLRSYALLCESDSDRYRCP